MLSDLKELDLRVTRFFARRQNDLIRDIMTGLSALGSPVNSILFLLFSYAVRPVLFNNLLKGLVIVWGIVYSIKQVVYRGRPEGHLEAGFTSSFPSGHSATAFLIAGLLSEIFVSMTAFLFLTAGLVAFSRVYMQTHYLSDVVAGSLIGMLALMLI